MRVCGVCSLRISGKLEALTTTKSSYTRLPSRHVMLITSNSMARLIVIILALCFAGSNLHAAAQSNPESSPQPRRQELKPLVELELAIERAKQNPTPASQQRMQYLRRLIAPTPPSKTT